MDTKVTPYQWFPFGGGMRRCIGMFLALNEMKVALATILSEVELALAPGQKLQPVRRGITIVPKGGVKVVVTKKPGPRP